MKKKKYVAPKVSQVKLVVKDSVLGTCHSSPVMTPKIGVQCTKLDQCWFGPGETP